LKYKFITRGDEASENIKNLIRDIYLKNDEEVESNPEHVFAIGGDGTFLRAVHDLVSCTSKDCQIPCVVHGINTGTLGFFTSYTPVKEQLEELFNRIRIDQLCTRTIRPLSFGVVFDDNTSQQGLAINEITITTAERKTLTAKIIIDNNNFEKFKGTGLCISTTIGSTAYNKSLGGAVVHPDLDVIQLTEMAGINSASYQTLSSPMVLPADSSIEVETSDNLVITFDHCSMSLNQSNKKIKYIWISQSAFEFKLDTTNNNNFIKKLKRSFIISE